MFARTTAKCLRNSLTGASVKDILLQSKWKLQPGYRFGCTDLKGAIQESLKAHTEAIKKMRKENDDKSIGEIKVKDVFGGLRGLTLLVYEPSLVKPDTGVEFRGIPAEQIQEKLPKAENNGEQPLPEGMFWFLCTGCVPTEDQIKWMTNAWQERSQVPEYILDMLLNLPKNMHPATKFSAALTAMNMGNCLGKAIDSGEKKAKLWESVYEDVMNLLAKITSVASVIYTSSFRDCALKPIAEKEKDWTENFCLNMGFDDPQFMDFLRLFLVLNSDHGGGSIPAHTAHLVHSALSDAYLAYAAAVNGIAGYRDGLAIQEATKFVMDIMKDLGDCPSEDDLKQCCEKKAKQGFVPGYGHTVLQVIDPRYTILKTYAEKNLKDDKMVKVVEQISNILPPLLKADGKMPNTCPNVHAHSGVILQHFGMKEITFYPVLFAVSRALGVLSWLIWARGLGLPIERPKSITTEAFAKMFESKKKGGGCS